MRAARAPRETATHPQTPAPSLVVATTRPWQAAASVSALGALAPHEITISGDAGRSRVSAATAPEAFEDEGACDTEHSQPLLLLASTPPPPALAGAHGSRRMRVRTAASVELGGEGWGRLSVSWPLHKHRALLAHPHACAAAQSSAGSAGTSPK